MRSTRRNPCLSAISLALLWAATASHAEIYKWVDAKGRTHYSQNKEDAERAQAAEVKIKTHTPSAHETKASREYWQEQDRQFKERQNDREADEHLRNTQTGNAAAVRKPSLSGGKDDGSAASKCNLAQDILNGSVRLTNGGQIGDLERQTAANDIRRFCR
ncbi:MAG: DUF4124 domain-containing protein [Hylemonella sp.]|nr:DUF4124 domain-containing protein [Hylemonella sp.]